MAEPLINGEAYSWSQIVISIGQTEVYGVKKISYTDTQEMQNNYGRGTKTVSRGRGKITCEASITLHMNEVENLQRISTTGRLQDIKEFDITVAFLPESGGIVKHKIKACRFLNNGREVSEGDLEIETELNLIVAEIDWRA